MSPHHFHGVVLDTYAWVEYFAGTSQGKRVAEIVEESRERITPATVISELTEKNLKEGFVESEIDEMVDFIAMQTRVYPCDLEVARKAGELNFAMKKKVKGWGMLDSLNYAVAVLLGCAFVTGDPHFASLDRDDVIFLR